MALLASTCVTSAPAAAACGWAQSGKQIQDVGGDYVFAEIAEFSTTRVNAPVLGKNYRRNGVGCAESAVADTAFAS